ncbi:MAG: TonB-dependent receptor [Rufibacter sp.]
MPLVLGLGMSKVLGQSKLQGLVQDTQRNALPFVRIHLVEPHVFLGTNEKGEFSYVFPVGQEPDQVTVVASYVGKKDTKKVVTITKGGTATVEIVLEENNLYLNEVEVNARRVHTTNSNSSIVIGQNAIEQIQPYSLSDILLNLLPGQKILNPDLQSAKAINLRSVSTGNHALNNQFGTSIILDGEALSNNANLQTTYNGRSASLEQINPGGYNTADYTFSSVDLRQIPANNIEKIEVIQGVASAKYGDMSSGTIIIDRKAGVSPWSISARIQSGTNNLSLDKGFKLSPQLGALNVSLDYLNASPSITNKLKAYNRISTSLLWSTHLNKARTISSNVGVDFSTSLDDWKDEPDDPTRKVKNENRSIRLNYRGSWRTDKVLFDQINYSFSYSNSQQYSYESWYINRGVRPSPVSAEEGVFEGIFTYPNYQAETAIFGNPIRWSGSVNASLGVQTGTVQHAISYGLNYSRETNRSKGEDIDPYKPRWGSSSALFYGRDHGFENTPTLSNIGFYVEDRINTTLFGKNWSTSFGIRGDRQFKYFSFSPRLSTTLELTSSVSLNAAYGLATKSPGLVHVQPKPVYGDFTLLNHYTNNPKENLYVAYTAIIIPDNSALQSMRTQHLELGVQYHQPVFDVSITAFHKKTSNGFTPLANVLITDVPDYAILEARPNEKPVYGPIGTYHKGFLYYSKFSNALTTKDYGIEVLLSTTKIRALQTSFNLSTSLYYSEDTNPSLEVEEPSQYHYDRSALIGVYANPYSSGLEAISTLSSSHHLSKLGLLVNLRAQFFWDQWTENATGFNYPLAYYDINGQYHEIPVAERTNPEYAHLVKEPSEHGEQHQGRIYSNYHLKVSKEVRNVFRLSFYANNFLNYRPEYYDAAAEDLKILNQAPAFGMEVRLNLK